jgi:predicted alpha/beta superfamily hydrolase
VREHTATESVSILDEAFEMPQLGRSRRVWLYLPPDYDASGDTRYPVLYMHDGQNVFDDATSYVGEWGVDETLDSLHAAGELSLIVVAVDHGGEHRFDEYNPWTHAQYGGGEGDEYVDFLVETLKPYIDAHYRTLPDRLNTGIAGSSMGGLISFYAILRYPDVFGRAGVFSPAFWTAKPGVFELARAGSPVRPDPRIFMVSGALEDGLAEPGEYERDQIAMVDTLAAAGWLVGADAEVTAHIRDDGTHSEWFWRREFPEVVQWLFEAR